MAADQPLTKALTPFPPDELVQRVHLIDDGDVEATYVAEGLVTRERLERLLPRDWSWEGKRVLDFGCGAGRTLRHLLDEGAELFGCDVHAPSIHWLGERLSPPLHVLQNAPRPPLPYERGSFDLVYALSVFTHIEEGWAEWLLELRRVLRPNGVLIATFLNDESWRTFGEGEWDEEGTGMLVTMEAIPTEAGGPFVFHSEWWLREHWGRAFEVDFVERHPPVSVAGQTAGAVVLRPRLGHFRTADLERGNVALTVFVTPFPPVELMQRVGKIDDDSDLEKAYDEVGDRCRARLERLLPPDWSWEGKAVLDFGCGAGRTLRHFVPEANDAEFHGCDIDGPSVAWLARNLSPPFHVFQSAEAPSLPQSDAAFDLVYAFSVFTHLTDHWAGWLLELHRVLKPDGLLFATFLSRQLWGTFGVGDWDEDRIGMNMTRKWNPWDGGGPIVFHSDWWLRERWGRSFEVLEVERDDPDRLVGEGQGAALLRRRPVDVTKAELERLSDDPRELAALRFNVEQLEDEAAGLFAQLIAAHAALDESARSRAAETEQLRAELALTQAELDRISNSRSWRLTSPLRSTAKAVRRR